MIRFEGRKARPTCSGLYPSTSCRYKADRKNQANIAAAQKTPTTFAVATFRSLKRRSGTSGELTRASIATKIANSTAAAVSRPIVRAVAQPTSLPLTMA